MVAEMGTVSGGERTARANRCAPRVSVGNPGLRAVDSLRGVYVLVVDGTNGRMPVPGILRYCGAYVRHVDSALTGLALMTQMLPDVLVVALADRAGLELIRQVRTLKPEKGGVIHVVGLGAAELQERARLLGFDGYLAVPFDPWELCHLISTFRSL